MSGNFHSAPRARWPPRQDHGKGWLPGRQTGADDHQLLRPVRAHVVRLADLNLQAAFIPCVAWTVVSRASPARHHIVPTPGGWSRPGRGGAPDHTHSINGNQTTPALTLARAQRIDAPRRLTTFVRSVPTRHQPLGRPKMPGHRMITARSMNALALGRFDGDAPWTTVGSLAKLGATLGATSQHKDRKPNIHAVLP